MKIGDEVYIHGYIDEMRKDIAIIKNEGGYFGAVYDEIQPKQINMSVIEDIKSEIETQKKGFPPSSDYYKAINRVLNIIDKHISGKE